MQIRKIAAAVAAFGIVAAGIVAADHYGKHPELFSAQAAQQAPAPAQAARAAAALPDFAAIVQQAGPAVVNITVSGTRKTGFSGMQDDEGQDENPFSQFFHGMPFRFGPPPAEVPMQGQGSGFIVGADGVVLTNAHVVRGASEVTVKLTDRREFSAKVLGTDPATDIAVLRIDAKGLPVVSLGDPARARVGDWVLAIGSPFGFENSVSAGIVSAKGRSLPGETYVPFIQTDVAVNPGNSGGPLFNLNGEVIGINSQIYSRSGGYQGLSFAIPIDVALRVKDQIVATGHASHARLGVTVQQLNQALADSFGLKRAEGALVSSVVPGSAAEQAGLQPGDVILKFDGKPVGTANELSAMVGEASPGNKARLEVWRKGQSQELIATLGAAKPESERTAATDGSGKDRLGLAVRPLTPEERKEAKVAGGLLVEDVNGAAARAGMQPGDIVLMADGKPVKSVADLRAAASARGNVALLVQRGDTRVFVPLKAG
ncbi:MAG TPA: DegQ family serine endoprotease [Burkholderiales bacterium]|nr:DegQ family serine endoprotease [Burkholderiales bacterium]